MGSLRIRDANQATQPPFIQVDQPFAEHLHTLLGVRVGRGLVDS
jgi:hypothetical protein